MGRILAEYRIWPGGFCVNKFVVEFQKTPRIG
jgi:hypothetical protein